MTRSASNLLSEHLAAEDLAELDRRRVTQQRRFYARRPKKLENVMAQLVQRRGYAQVRAASQRDEAWEAALKQLGNPVWAASTQVVGLRRGVIHVLVGNSLAMQELTFEKERLLAKLQETLSDDDIKQIKFTVGTIS